MQETADKRTELARTGRGWKLGGEGKVDEGKVGKSTAGMEYEKPRGSSQPSATILQQRLTEGTGSRPLRESVPLSVWEQDTDGTLW